MKREDILAVYAAGPDAVVALVEQLLASHQDQVAELTARIVRLESRLNQDSHNSHKPTSSDPAPDNCTNCGAGACGGGR